MNFIPNHYPHPSRRTAIYGANGMVASTSPLASQIGLDVLKKGGNAIDAALAVAATMPVVEPTSNGLGSDCFAIVYYKGALYGLNGSGRSAKNISIDALRSRGYEDIPTFGPIPVGLPGAVSGWMALHDRFASMDLEDLFEGAIGLAQEGFPLSPTIARLWQDEVEKYSPYKDDPAFAAFFEEFTLGGRAPREGEIFANPNLASSLRAIAATKGEAFYRGDLAQKISDFLGQHGGFLEKSDLEAHTPLWVDPISTNYRGIDVWELPPNGHGISVLMALEILEGYDLASLPLEKRLHLQIEAMKLAMVDAAKYVTDPDHMSTRVEDLLSRAYSSSRRSLIKDQALDPLPGLPHCPSTVYFATGDREGNMVSMIQSNYMGFGSGLVVPGTGISLNNRVHNFSMDPCHDNCLVGGKRPYHTIIPGFLTKEGRALGPFGVMGAFMQPQGQAQVLVNMIDLGLNPQAALDGPRFQWLQGRDIELEEDFPPSLAQDLMERGHRIQIQKDPINMGRGQIILRQENGVYCGGTEKRADGYIAVY